jgi:menaquinone-9 beta-reductase
MTRADFDAVIIGAGPAGASAAILLARAGWRVAIVEKQRFPRRKVCGECIAASNLPLLHALGIGAEFDAAAGPELKRVALMRGRHVIEADLPAADHPDHRWGRALGRETLDTLLLAQARAAGAHVLQPWAVQAIGGAAGDWRCSVRAIETNAELTLHAPIAIAAHGSWEVLPSARPRRRLARSGSDLFAFKANFRHAALAEGLLPVLSFEGGYGGMVVAEEGITTLACCVRRDRMEACRSEFPGVRAGDVVEALLRRECAGVRNALQGASRDTSWLAAGPIDPGIRLGSDAGHNGLFRIGNAAGEAHPIIGEGMSMALQSAHLLCAGLLGADRLGADLPCAERCRPGWQREVALHYAAAWRGHFGARLRLAAGFAHAAMRPRLAQPLLALTRAWPGLLTAGARWGGKVRCAVDPDMLAGLTRASPSAPLIDHHAIHPRLKEAT